MSYIYDTLKKFLECIDTGIVFFFLGKVGAILTNSFSEDCFFFRVPKSARKEKAVFFPGKVPTGLTDSSQRLCFFLPGAGKKQKALLLTRFFPKNAQS